MLVINCIKYYRQTGNVFKFACRLMFKKFLIEGIKLFPIFNFGAYTFKMNFQIGKILRIGI